MIGRSLVAILFAVTLTVAAASLVGTRSVVVAGSDGIYTSPTYGYSLTWDVDRWEAIEESSLNDFDLLSLTDGRSFVSISAAPTYGATLQDCLDIFVEGLVAEGFTNPEPLIDVTGEPTAGATSRRAFAAYRLIEPDEDREYTLYVECRDLASNQAALSIMHLVVSGDYADQSAPVRALLRTIVLPSQPPIVIPPTDRAISGGDQFGALMLGLAADADALWVTTFADGDLTYSASDYIFFTDRIESPCGPARPGDGPFYCGFDNTIYLDAPWLLRDAANAHGTLALAMIIAHETGHTIQAQLELDLETTSIQDELQADCFAGAYLATLVANGEATEAEVQAILPFVRSIGDEPGSSPSDEDAHGTGVQRTSALLRGYDRGVDACIR